MSGLAVFCVAQILIATQISFLEPACASGLSSRNTTPFCATISVLTDADVEIYRTRIEKTSFSQLDTKAKLELLRPLISASMSDSVKDDLAKTFLNKNGIPLVLTAANTIDGTQATQIRSKSADNRGLYKFSRGPGQARFLKVPKLLGPHFFLDLIRKINGLTLMETRNRKLGGPILGQFGRLTIENGNRRTAYFEFDEANPRVKPLTLEDIYLLPQSAQIRYLSQKTGGTSAPEKMADEILDTMNKGIAPVDLEFMVTENGKIMWIDGDYWTEQNQRPELIDLMAREVQRMLAYLHEEEAAVFVLRLLHRVKGTTYLQEDEKISFLRSIFSDISTLEPVDYEKILQTAKIVKRSIDYNRLANPILNYYSHTAYPIPDPVKSR